MLAVHLERGDVEVRQTPRPHAGPGFALIRLLTAGICSTDLELQRGYYGFSGIPGHEFVGEVVEASSPHLLGKRVVGEINLACTHCDWCARGLGRHCPDRAVLGIVNHAGAFAEFLTLPERNLRVLPDDISTQHAVFVEPLAAACQILDQTNIPRGSAVAVLGDGKLGLLIAQALNARGLRVQQFGRHKNKLRIAERMGVTVELARGSMPVAEFDWVVDATGSAEGLKTAAAMVRPLGTLILKSTVHGLVPIDVAPIIVNEITMIGSRCGRFEPALELLQGGRINVEDIISETLPLSAAPEAFRKAAQNGVMKLLLTEG